MGTDLTKELTEDYRKLVAQYNAASSCEDSDNPALKLLLESITDDMIAMELDCGHLINWDEVYDSITTAGGECGV